MGNVSSLLCGRQHYNFDVGVTKGPLVVSNPNKPYKKSVLLCNFDATSDFSQIQNLIENAVPELAIEFTLMPLLSVDISMLSSATSVFRNFDAAVLVVSSLETRLSVNESDRSGIGYGRFYRKLRSITEDHVAICFTNDSHAETNPELIISEEIWSKVFSQFDGETEMVNGSKGLILSLGAKPNKTHSAAVSCWLSGSGSKFIEAHLPQTIPKQNHCEHTRDDETLCYPPVLAQEKSSKMHIVTINFSGITEDFQFEFPPSVAVVLSAACAKWNIDPAKHFLSEEVSYFFSKLPY